MPVPTISTIIASSSDNVASLLIFSLPIAYFAIAVIVVISVITLIVVTVRWVGHKISGLMHHSPAAPSTYSNDQAGELRRIHDMFPRG